MTRPRRPALPGLLVFLFLFMTMTVQAQVRESFLQEHEDRLDRLFSSLDPAHPEMSDIRLMWEAGNRAKAASALCEYYTNKEFPLEVLDAPLIPGNFMKQADKATQATFFLLNEWEPAPVNQDGSINWTEKGSKDDKERAWMLNRHAFFVSLSEAHHKSGEVRYKETLNSIWSGWITDNPYPDRLTFSAPWRALEVARRILNSWVYSFYGYNILNDESRLLVLSSVLDHADALLEHTSFWGGNHLITEKMALLATAAAWPEFERSKEWRTDAIKVISNEFMSQTYPDGSYKELSNHYQRVVLTNTTKFLKLLEAVDHPENMSIVVERIEQMWDFFAGVMRPDGFGPLNNAGDREKNAAYLKEVWERFDRPDWLHMATNGSEGPALSGPPLDDTEVVPPADIQNILAEGPALSGPPLDDTEVVPPPGPSRLFPWAGQAILRTGWERGAGWVYFDAGPYGTAHQHVDRLHVSVALKGRPLLVDNGRYVYRPGKWKDYFQGPEGHNILLLDGKPSKQAPREVRQPMEIIFEQTDAAAFAAASAHYPPNGTFAFFHASTLWTRAVLLDGQGRFALVLDHILSFRQQEWKALWHFHPYIPAQAATAVRLISGSENYRIKLQRGSENPEVAGFHSPEYNVRQPAVQMEHSGTLSGPTTLIWLIQLPDDPPLEVEMHSDHADPVQHIRIHNQGKAIADIQIQLYPKPKLIGFN